MTMQGYFDQHFPNMTPISSAPSVWSIFGCGLMAYGQREHDAESGTCVKTRFFTIPFIPIFAIDAYRVAPATEDWFIGQVPLSNLARAWNVLVVLAMLLSGVGVWYHYHSKNADVIANRTLTEGDELAEHGLVGAAAKKYLEVAGKRGTPAHFSALEKLSQLFRRPLDDVDPGELLQAIAIGVDLHELYKRPDNLFEVGLAQAKLRAERDSLTSWRILNQIDPIAAHGDKRIAEIKKPILEKIGELYPDNLEALSDLAFINESGRRYDECEKLLMPKRDQLGHLEGARILGQILINKGDLTLGTIILEGYTDDRLKKLNALDEVYNRVSNAAIRELQTGKAPGFDYERHRALQNDRRAQNEMFKEYLDGHLFRDAQFQQLKDIRRTQGRIVAAGLDLGTAQIRLAKLMDDPERRRAGLQKAELTLLGTLPSASNPDNRRLHLARVYYWLGKEEEGKKLFDEALKNAKNPGQVAYTVANILREVGAVVEARKLCEDFYEKEIGGEKTNLARTRALMSLDLDDRLLWLDRIFPPDLMDKTFIAMAKGDKAHEENRNDDAVAHYREALKLYGEMSEDYAQLNNSALVHFAISRITGDTNDIERGLGNLEKAYAIKPGDSIVVRNMSTRTKAKALREVIGAQINLNLLKTDASMELVSFLYNDQAKKNQFREAIRGHAGMAASRKHYERLLVVSPRDAHNYSVLANHFYFMNDHDALKQLRDAVAKANVEHADALRHFKDVVDRVKQDKRVKELEHAVDYDQKRVEEARRVGGATLAFALANLVRDKISLQILNQPVNVDELVAWAEEAHKLAPSRGSRNVLVDAFLARAHQALMKTDPAYDAMARKHHHWLGIRHLIAIALGQEGKTRDAVQAHADVVRVQELLKETTEAFPEEFGEWIWAMVRHSDSTWASARAKQWQDNALVQTFRSVAQYVSAPTANELYRQYWTFRMQGHDEEADAILRKLADQDYPRPK